MADLLLLPTARSIPPELQTEFGAIPPALIPLEGTPAFQLISAKTWQNGDRVVLAAHDGIELIDEYVKRHADIAVDVVDVGATVSLGETILNALSKSDAQVDRLVINFADTYVDDVPAAGSFVTYRRQSDSHRWTAFSCDDEGAIHAIVDKDAEKDDGRANVFVGVFGFTDIERLRQCLHDATARVDLPYDPFYQALIDYSASHGVDLHETESWYDFGHLDTYYATRQQFFLNHRLFNSVNVDVRRGVIRKTSNNSQKLADEISWYMGLPKDLSALAPRVLDYSFDAHNTFVDMEFYGYPPLAESYLHGAWDSGVWHHVFRTLGETAEMMRSHRTLDGPDNASRRRELLDAMYVSKTQQRLVDVKKDIRLVDLMGESVSINGALCLGLEGATSVLQRVVDAAGLCEAEYLSVVHGDMCLSNILFDRRTSIVRLIDPRGSFGSSFSIYGDARYDLAKLSHSILGDYDHLVHGLFDCTVGNEGAYLQAHVSQRQQAVKNQFDKWLKATTGIEYAQVRLIESLLFLSMVPLHADNSRSQMAFLVRGLEMFSTSARRFGCWHPRTESAPAIQIHA